MKTQLELDISRQPDRTTCGPTCLHAVYRYWRDPISIDEVIHDAPALEAGGTLGVMLGQHALGRGYRATITNYNLRIFDPTWFQLPRVELMQRLRARRERSGDGKMRIACEAYERFLEAGGQIQFQDLSPRLIRRELERGVPILTGLSATWLYREPREVPETGADDDIGGHAVGHFVVLFGEDRRSRRVLVADPLEDNPFSPNRRYEVPIERLINSILLGILTYDANLLVIEPARRVPR